MEKPVDYTKLPPELVDKLEKIEARKPENVQIKRLEEIQSILEMVFTAMRDDKGKEERSTEEFSKVAKEIRDYVKSIEAKEAPETPDTAKPVVDGLKALEKALTTSIKGIDVKPNVNVTAPTVDIKAPDVNTKGIEKAVKDLGKEFEKAVKLIPKTEVPEDKDYTQVFNDMLEQLQSIDTASRMKPMFPVSQLNTLAAVDFATSAKQDDIISAIQASGSTATANNVFMEYKASDSNIIYIGEATNATATSAASWKITRLDLNTLLDVTYADGNLNYDNLWDNRESLTYT